MLRAISAAAVIGWLIFSWPVALAIVGLSLFIAMFYSGCLEGPADEKAEKVLCFTIIFVSIVALGAFGDREREAENDQGVPRMCMHVQC